MLSTDIRIREVKFDTEDFAYRTPIKFGGVVLDRATILNVEIRVEDRAGKSQSGFGSMPLSNAWAYPSKKMAYAETLGAMRLLTERIRQTTEACPAFGHPIDLTHEMEADYLMASRELSKGYSDAIPPLAALVCASPFDAALHDAFGKLHGLNCYGTYGPDFLPNDLGHYLGSDYRGIRIDDCLTRDPLPTMPLYHLVGALDPLTAADVQKPVGDGLPETLEEWIPFNGLTHFKIKLNGEEADWDVERVLAVAAVCEREQPKHGIRTCFFSLDFNEKCANVAYLLEVLAKIRERSPLAFERIQYIEQPTKRDLKNDSQNVMHAASKLKPVVIDEALLDLESLILAKEMGYTGAALKACKGQTQSLLMAGAVRHMKMFLCVQDLTCPGASLIHSAGLAAHVKGVAAIEANSRQYCPAANKPWEAKFPGIFNIADGTMKTGELTGKGLGAV